MTHESPPFRKGGRPRKPDLQKRKLLIAARVRPDELAIIEGRAAATNCPLSDFIRELALSGTILVRQSRMLSAIDRHDLARIGSRQQFRQRRLFNARESSLLGVIGNAVRLHHANRNAPGMPGLFRLVFSRRARQQQFQRQIEGQKQDLRKCQAQRRQGRADTLRASCRLELSRLSETFQKQRAEMLTRHAGEASEQKAVWRQLAADRAKVWSDYRKAFATGEPVQEQRSASPRQFNDAATGRRQHPDKPEQERTPPIEPKKRDWRARRSAAERKADGSYEARERNRDNENSGRSRQRDRYDHD